MRIFFREPEVLETGMIMPHEKEKFLVYTCIQKKLYIWLTPKILALDKEICLRLREREGNHVEP